MLAAAALPTLVACLTHAAPERTRVHAARIESAHVDVLQDRVLSRQMAPAAQALRGLRLLYDTPLPGGATLAVVRSVTRANHRLDPFEALVLATAAVDAARVRRLDYGFFCSTLLQESGFDAGALSPAGAVGIAQFTLDTAALEQVDPFDWRDAIRGAAAVLARYVGAYDGLYPDPYAAALAAYNAGPGTVAYYRGIPPYPETEAYISDVYDRWSRIVRDAVGLRGRARRLQRAAPGAGSRRRATACNPSRVCGSLISERTRDEAYSD